MVPNELRRAVRQNDISRVAELLNGNRNGIDVNGRDRRGYSPLMYAVSNPIGNLDLVELLIRAGIIKSPFELVTLCGRKWRVARIDDYAIPDFFDELDPLTYW